MERGRENVEKMPIPPVRLPSDKRMGGNADEFYMEVPVYPRSSMYMQIAKSGKS
jgi:hypothetical protein